MTDASLASVTDTAAARSGPAARSRLRRLPLAPWLYLLPTLAVLVTWVYWPLFRAFQLSFTQWNMLPTQTPRPVGLENYKNLLALPELHQAAMNTVWYVLGLLPLSVIIPLAVAILTQDLRGPMRNLYRSLIFVPMIVPPIVAAVLWRWLLNRDYGLVNRAIEAMGFDAVRFFQDPDVALWTMVWITGWKLMGFSTLLFSAANSTIDPGYLEAARMDGASNWQITRDIRLPLLSPTILLLTMMTVLFGAQWSFVYINAITDGGPMGATANVFFLMWKYGFQTFSAGWSATAGVMTFLVFGLLAMAFLGLSKKVTFHDD
ncbi:MAG: glycerol-3-phosphate ABC transporter permease [Pseudooceanicola sp.]|nr:glycerol-3-phosphate ABC transporter permease [Pseudooceanicola sp.]|tara:strand:- start:471 stop:1424 length:954 start_codon:yes stop_codon:yes gene_type:complete